MVDNVDAALIFDIIVVVALAFAAGLIRPPSVAARAPRGEQQIEC